MVILLLVLLTWHAIVGGPADLPATEDSGNRRPRTAAVHLQPGPKLTLPPQLSVESSWRLPAGFGRYGATANHDTAVIPAGAAGLLWVARDSGVNGLRPPTVAGRELVSATPMDRGWLLLETEPFVPAAPGPGNSRSSRSTGRSGGADECRLHQCWHWQLAWVSSPMPGSEPIPVVSSQSPVTWLDLPAIRANGAIGEWLEPGRAVVGSWSGHDTPGRVVRYRPRVPADKRWADRAPSWISVAAEPEHAALRASGYRLPEIPGAVRRVLTIGTEHAYVRTDEGRFLVTSRGRRTSHLAEDLLVGAAPAGITVVGSDERGAYLAIVGQRGRSSPPRSAPPRSAHVRSIAWRRFDQRSGSDPGRQPAPALTDHDLITGPDLWSQ